MVKEVVKIDRELLEMVHSIRFSRFFRPKSREDCFHASESTKISSAPMPSMMKSPSRFRKWKYLLRRISLWIGKR